MAAGQGFIEFSTGDVLTAAAANGYLASQVVMVFASAAARTSAIASPQEGMISYLKDTNSTEYYSGSAWVAIGGGGLSSPLTTKGDVWGYSTTNARIPVGTNGQVLTADSAETLGVKWASPAGGGKVLQVIQGTYSTSTTVSSATMTDTGLSLSITPTLSTSKILVLTSQIWTLERPANEQGHAMRILRGATEIYSTQSTNTAGYIYAVGASSVALGGIASLCYLDSPATTSSTTYKTQGRLQVAAGAVYYQSNSATSTITLMEIGA